MTDKVKKIIGIDARLYGPSAKGLGRYVQEVVDRVTRMDTENEYKIFLSKDNFDNFKPAGEHVQKVLAKSRWYTLAEQFEIPRLIKSHKLDIFHVPHFNAPLYCPAKLILTIHDLILTKYPSKRASTLGAGKYWFKNLAYRLVISTAIRKAKKIITVSNFTKGDLVKTFGANINKIAVTYEGVFEPASNPLKNDDKNVLISYNIHNSFLLYVGSAYPHKNLENLIRAIPKISRQIPGLQLVLVGGEDYFYQRLKKEFAGQNRPIIFAGYVPDDVLNKLYARALAFVFPSKYEGFGLPPLEAMSQGCPVASSNMSSMPEILGDAAIYFDPHDREDMQKQILKICRDKELRSKLINKGYDQVKKYSWQACAKQTLKVYRNTLS